MSTWRHHTSLFNIPSIAGKYLVGTPTVMDTKRHWITIIECARAPVIATSAITMRQISISPSLLFPVQKSIDIMIGPLFSVSIYARSTCHLMVENSCVTRHKTLASCRYALHSIRQNVFCWWRTLHQIVIIITIQCWWRWQPAVATASSQLAHLHHTSIHVRSTTINTFTFYSGPHSLPKIKKKIK